jgi:ABC-type multidrug transport system ATPase subunit
VTVVTGDPTAAEVPFVQLTGVSLAGDDGLPVLDELDLAVRRGEVFAVLGSHGAGKTTLLDVVAGLVRPEQGTVELRLTASAEATAGPPEHQGRRKPDPTAGPESVDRRRHLVYAGSNGLHERLTPVDNVRFFLALAGCAARPQGLEIENLLREVGVPDACLGLRLGLAPRAVPALVHLGLAVLRGVPLVLLDDPTLGLDSADANAFRASVRFVRDRGITVLLATSDVMLAGGAADRVGMLAAGRIAFVRERGGWFDHSALELYAEYLGEPERRAPSVGPLLGEDRTPI